VWPEPDEINEKADIGRNKHQPPIGQAPLWQIAIVSGFFISAQNCNPPMHLVYCISATIVDCSVFCTGALHLCGGFFGIFLAFILLLSWLGSQGESPVAVMEPPVNSQNRPIAKTEKPIPSPQVKLAPEPQQIPATFEQRFVSGNRVALRSGPSQKDAVIDRLETGRAVDLIESGSEWSKVRDPLTRRVGWIASHLLRSERTQKVSKPQPTPTPPVVRKKSVDNGTIIARIIEESIASYLGSCPCPYNTDRGGRRCGKRSAYSRPGGYDPICFAGDVTPDMIEAMKARN
jgi:SH3-like domain-containing protein